MSAAPKLPPRPRVAVVYPRDREAYCAAVERAADAYAEVHVPTCAHGRAAQATVGCSECDEEDGDG